MVQIDKQIEIPAVTKSTGRKPKYPWAQLSVGDSFFLPNYDLHTCGGITRHRKKKGEDYTLRTVVESGVKGVRIWRIQ